MKMSQILINNRHKVKNKNGHKINRDDGNNNNHNHNNKKTRSQVPSTKYRSTWLCVHLHSVVTDSQILSCSRYFNFIIDWMYNFVPSTPALGICRWFLPIHFHISHLLLNHMLVTGCNLRPYYSPTESNPMQTKTTNNNKKTLKTLRFLFAKIHFNDLCISFG